MLDLHNAHRPLLADLAHQKLSFRMTPGDAFRLIALCADLGWHPGNDRRHYTYAIRKEAPYANRRRQDALNWISVYWDRPGFPAIVEVAGPEAINLVQAALTAGDAAGREVSL
jgi:hypothetical protein